MRYAEQNSLPITRAEFSKLEVFKNVSFESLAGYLLGCEVICAKVGEILINPDHPQRRLIVVLEGLLEFKTEVNGESFTNIIKPGQCAGEMSILDNIKPSGVVYAKEPSRLLVIKADIALAMINVSHDLCLNFLYLLSKRLRNNDRAVCEEKYHIRCIEENARVDALTGLHNRRWLEEMYTREIHRSNAGDYRLSAFMMDIDHFKNVNDTYGHLAGDRVLIYVAKTIRESLRPSDMPVRYGGEEFTVFLPSTTTENAKVIAERIRGNMERKDILLPSGQVIHVTISIGFTEFMEGDTVDSIIHRADQALYYAKNNGRNKICLNLDGRDMFLF